MSSSNYVHLEVEKILAVTEKAMLLRVEGEEYWIPLSHVADADDYRVGEEDLTVSVSDWIASQKGLA